MYATFLDGDSLIAKFKTLVCLLRRGHDNFYTRFG